MSKDCVGVKKTHSTRTNRSSIISRSNGTYQTVTTTRTK